MCDRSVPWSRGTAVFASRFPTYWDYNTLRITGPLPAGVAPGELIAEADRLQAELAFRRFDVEDEAAGEALAPRFAALGWRVQRLWHMLHDGSERPVAPSVTECDRAGVRSLRTEWLLADGFDDPSFLDAEAEAAALLPGEPVVLAAHDAAGDPAAYVQLRIDGDRGEIEDAYCTPGSRGRGLARALVCAAIARAQAAGVRDLLIVADADDWPKDLYGRLGFSPVWRPVELVRPPGQPVA